MFLLKQAFNLILLTGVLFSGGPRIISLAPSITDFLIELKLDKYIVGKTYLDPENIKAEIVLPPSMRISKEKILNLKPTHIISAGLVLREDLEFFKNRKIKVIDIEYRSLMDIVKTFVILGEEFNSRKIALEKLRSFLDTLFIFRNIKKGEKVLFVLDLTNGIWCPGKNTFISDLLEFAGFKNITDFYEGYKSVSIEKIIKNEPDAVIFNFKNPEKILKGTPLEKLKAIREKRFYEVPDPDYFSRPSPEIIRALKFLSTIN
jgi:ABC-type Fe3+-hydroxamate transport system substrate-binding protein